MPTQGPTLDLPPWDDGAGARRGPTPVEWALLALGAVGRRKAVTLLVVLASLGTFAAYYAYRLRAPTYRVETRILAQRQQALPSVVRSIYEDVPTRSAWEIVHRRDNLLAIVRQVGLLPEPGGASEGGTGAAANDGPAAALVNLLDKQLLVSVEEGTITIRLDWNDPRQAYDIVQTALQNFLEARYLQEVTAVDEVLTVLSGQAAVLRNGLDTAVDEARRRAAQPPRVAAPRVRVASEDLARLQSRLESKQRAVQEVEEFRRRRLADLQAQLDQARNSLSEAHPTVIALRRDIAALSRESPQMDTLREEERQARKDYQARLAREGYPAAATAAPVVLAPPSDLGTREEDQRVRESRLQYEQLMLRIQTAEVERDAARAAFKYRYNVIWPPQLPSEPVSPNPRKLGILAVLGSLVLAIAAAAAPDLLRGRIVERWQVERSLDLPILGEIERRP